MTDPKAITLPPDVVEALQRLARERGTTIAEVLKQAVVTEEEAEEVDPEAHLNTAVYALAYASQKLGEMGGIEEWQTRVAENMAEYHKARDAFAADLRRPRADRIVALEAELVQARAAAAEWERRWADAAEQALKP